MRRLIVLTCALCSLAITSPGVADAKAPCRDRVFNDWYRDGKIASTYPLSCYRDALKHIPPDVGVYSSLGDDIRLALQAAVNRDHGQKVPEQVGSGTELASSTPPSSSSTKNGGSADTAPNAADPGAGMHGTQVTPVAASPASSGSSGLPLPVLVLGGVALVLVASGGIGLGVRRFRRN